MKVIIEDLKEIDQGISFKGYINNYKVNLDIGNGWVSGYINNEFVDDYIENTSKEIQEIVETIEKTISGGDIDMNGVIVIKKYLEDTEKKAEAMMNILKRVKKVIIEHKREEYPPEGCLPGIDYELSGTLVLDNGDEVPFYYYKYMQEWPDRVERIKKISIGDYTVEYSHEDWDYWEIDDIISPVIDTLLHLCGESPY